MKRNLLLLSILCMAIFASVSCSKKNDDDDELVVKYEVLHSDARVTSIDYTNAAGGGGYQDFPPANWSTEIRPDSRPFTASLKVIFENPDNTVVNYTLIIRVNGEVKASKDVSLAASSTDTEHIEYVIE